MLPIRGTDRTEDNGNGQTDTEKRLGRPDAFRTIHYAMRDGLRESSGSMFCRSQ
jgi:hypothetical protein